MAESIGQLLQQAEDRHRAAREKHLRLVQAEGRRSIAEQQDLGDLEARIKDAGASKRRA